MRTTVALGSVLTILGGALALCVGVLAGPGGVAAGGAVDLTKVTVAVDSVGLHPGMPPGMYVCAGGHLHIRGTVQNLTGVALHRITLAGKAFDRDGTLLGASSASPKRAVLAPGEKAQFDLEFLTVTGPRIQRAARHEITAVEAHPAH